MLEPHGSGKQVREMAKEYSRTQRIGDQMQRELALLIQREIKDPRLGLVTITGVDVARDLSHAKVYVTVMGQDDNAEVVKQNTSILNDAASYLLQPTTLAFALAATGLQVAGLRCLDVGQSTGGFTDCLLAHGAAQVIGVDVGHGQLHERLRADVRVVCVEGMNARAMTAEVLQDACEEVISERWEEEEDNDTQPKAPYAWMRNGGQVDPAKIVGQSFDIRAKAPA